MMLLSTAVASADEPGKPASATPRPITISEAVRDEDGVLVHHVTSPYQAGTTKVRVLLPDDRPEGSTFPVIYVLPVEACEEHRYGNGLRTILQAGLHHRTRAIFVAPTFSALPWYADHPSDPEIRQESYFLNVVLPLVERRYPVKPGRNGRLLLGFSKSGWGAYSLLLRHPDRFAKAAAWDAPLMKERPDQFGMGPIFGTQENFESYRITTLLRRRADAHRDGDRLILLGIGNFRDHHEEAHALMTELQIRHLYEDGPKRIHVWESGWVPGAVARLLDDADAPEDR